mmetsp:Transcript_8170/g.21041  ORF Transcript_8170/g.21041 Transcript_8170/m.21041 type:complete len:103 (-) Transcript_8170:97-405(-)
MLGTHREREVQKGIAQLKLAFDNLEKVKPGLSAEVLGAVYGLSAASRDERARTITAAAASASARRDGASSRAGGVGPPPAAASQPLQAQHPGCGGSTAADGQ